MKFPLSWLKRHIDTDATAQQVADALNRIGLEVEGIENPADRLSAFRIAKVLRAEPHPQADKLQVLSVDAGNGPMQVVCGAPNARAGLVGVFGSPGTVVPANGMVLKVAAIRGVESNGMMCSVAELELGDDHDGIIELPEDAPVGQVYADWAGLDDPVIEVAITPNRPDCMGINGIARDLVAFDPQTFRPRSPDNVLVEGKFAFPMKIGIEEGSGCRTFWGRVIRGVKDGPSPVWLQNWLKAVGLRPISALVDITNFFSYDQARPLHVYDIAKLNGAVVARRGRAGESFVALNGKSYDVTTEDCVIADDAHVLGLGGVMGGEESGVSETTTDVLLECAWFDPEMVGETGRRHAITSDARARFERGIDPMMMGTVIETATQMIIDLCGGEASEPRIATDLGPDDYPNGDRLVAYRPALTKALAGVEVSVDEQRAILARLGFFVLDPQNPELWRDEESRQTALAKIGIDPAAPADPDHWVVRFPTWRPDIDGAADIVEEVVRIHGIDRVPSTPLPRADGVAKPTATLVQSLERKVRRAAAARGLNEAINWSFIPEKEAEAFGGGQAAVANPISEDMKIMRPSLLPGLLSAAQRNMNRGAQTVRLFEIGRRYLAVGERLTAGIVLAGEKTPRGWASGKATKFDAFDAKAEVQALLTAAGVSVETLMIMPVLSGAESGDAGEHYHPGQSATLRMGPKNVVAAFGTLHPATARAFDLDGNVVVAEIYLDAIPVKKSSAFMRAPFTPPTLQPVTRDFAFLVAADLPSGDLVRAIRGVDKQNIVAVRLFDQFVGQGVPEGQKSLAVEVTLQPMEKTYGDDDLKTISEKIIAAAVKLGGTLRA
ncbi:MAG: phenylalanine--tRNA ligase subunit beta [Sphingomonadaceae bacterium]|nr:phenylalanine--tRNA ligase subunit beta [Sphingomonadaceae bacterium]